MLIYDDLRHDRAAILREIAMQCLATLLHERGKLDTIQCDEFWGADGIDT